MRAIPDQSGGRRLSLEEMEIRKQLNLSTEILRLLVTRRLLRSENRSDSYYELSHDALIEPVLATRRRKHYYSAGWDWEFRL